MSGEYCWSSLLPLSWKAWDQGYCWSTVELATPLKSVFGIEEVNPLMAQVITVDNLHSLSTNYALMHISPRQLVH